MSRNTAKDFGIEDEMIPSRGPGGRALTGQLGSRVANAQSGGASVLPAPPSVLAKSQSASLPSGGDAIAELKALRAVMNLVLLSQSDPPVTDVSSPLSCAVLNSGKWVEFYRNELPRRVRVQVFCEWGVAGAGVRIAKRNDGNDEQVIDVMTESGTFGKTESQPVVLKPGEVLFVKAWRTDAPTLAAMTSASVLRARIFDPQDMLDD